jgi:putative Mn2+ efflux pump MntP
MTLFEITLIAVALAMDCFAVSIASGITLKRVLWSTFLTMGFLFGVFQGGMTLIGWALTNWASQMTEAWDHWLAFTLLSFLGGKMIYEHFTNEDCNKNFNPTNLWVIITLSVATSIDALAVGISFACLETYDILSILSPVFIIGIVAFLFSIIGSIIGATIGNKVRIHAELFGGILLIAIGLKILLEHTVAN